MRANYYNLTRVNQVDLSPKYDNNIISTNEPKIKGYFVALLVKPDLNLWWEGLDDYNIGNNINQYNRQTYTPGGKSYIRTAKDASRANITKRKLFSGLITEPVMENLVHNEVGNKSGDWKIGPTNYFSTIFANRVESVSYPDLSSNSEDTLVTLDKQIYKLPITEVGNSGMTFNVRLRETEGLESLRMLYIWHKYIHAVGRGNISPRGEHVYHSIIDYKAALYVLHLKPDFQTITMWTKYTGVYPTNIPVSIFSEDISAIQDVTIDVEFSYDRFELLNEDLLKELNLITSGADIFKNRLYSKEAKKAQIQGIHTQDTTIDGTLADNQVNNLKSKYEPLIWKITDTPYYRIDFNRLDAILNNRPIYDIFGNKIDSKDFHFAAPLNFEMANLQSHNLGKFTFDY